MDYPRSISGNGEDNGIPDDLRCKRSDGKQWRCTARSMPDKTVCEKHYVQAKKRAANSALRATMKKDKSKSLDEDDVYMESNMDDIDTPNIDMKVEDYPVSLSRKKHKGSVSKNEFCYSPETQSMRGLSPNSSSKDNDDDFTHFEETRRSYQTPPSSSLETSKHRPETMLEDEQSEESSDGNTDSSDDSNGKICHQCQRYDGNRVIWCQRCDKRGYCNSCISTWYSDFPLVDILRICPACRGICKCKVCSHGDSLIKVRMRAIPIQVKMLYFYSLLSSVLPVIKNVHYEQCSEVELEKKRHGSGVDLVRTKLNADEQMCCNFCRMPIIDYHRHCANCSYDLCLRCCKDIRYASGNGLKEKSVNISEEFSPSRSIYLSDKFFDWEASSDGSIPCPSRKYGGCGCTSLTLHRIFKMNWVAKLVKNVEEMVSGCKVYDDISLQKSGINDFTIYQTAHREDSDDNFVYCPSFEDIELGGLDNFKKHWLRGEPVIVKQVCDVSSCISWDPMLIWRGIQETSDEKMDNENKTVKAIDCLDWSEVNIELGEFIKGYSEGRTHEYGWPQLLKLKDWPSTYASEEYLKYQKPVFFSKLPLLEYIHSKWGLLNVAAKLPHYSLQKDVGPKIHISYGTYEELGRGDSVTNLHFNISDKAYFLLHTSEIEVKGLQEQGISKINNDRDDSQANRSLSYPNATSSDGNLLNMSRSEPKTQNKYETSMNANKDENMEDQILETTYNVEDKIVSSKISDKDCGDNVSKKTHAGAIWDVFRRQDVPKLVEYMKLHWKEFGKPDYDLTHPLHDQVVFLSRHHKRKLKEEFGIEPWSFEQHLGQAVFIPAGCPFQARNLQSTVQLGFDFLSPESLGESVKLAEEIRRLPNDHEAKTRVLEVEKMSLYAASVSIKEVHKLVLDPNSEIGFEDPNLTAMVSENLEKFGTRKEIICS